MSELKKIGLIFGSGELPAAVLEGALAVGHDTHIIALDGHVPELPVDVNVDIFGVGKFGAIVKKLRSKNCTHICFAGHVERPDFKKIKPDLQGWKKLPGAISAARQGDDALLSYLLEMFESSGFEIIAPQDLCAHILMPNGHLGDVKMIELHRHDAEKACRIAKDIGALDIGQGAIVCDGLVLAVEAQEGTDSMLKRISELPEAMRGTPSARRGVLAKMIKPGQEKRVDLPTIGPETINLADKAGLAGIVTEGGQSFVLGRDLVVKTANDCGIFIAGLPPQKPL